MALRHPAGRGKFSNIPRKGKYSVCGRILALCLALMVSGCAAAAEERLSRLEAAVEDLQSQEVRLTLLEGVVNTVVAEQRAAREGRAVPGDAGSSSPEPAYESKRAAPVARQSAAPGKNPVTKATPAPPPPNTGTPPAQPRKTDAGIEKSYHTALAALESGRPGEAMSLFAAFLREHPGHALAPNAGYWLGECHYSLKQYDSAIIAFKDVVAQFPQHDKAAAAMLKAGYSYAQLGDAANTRFYLEALLRDFPSSAPASLARARLNTL